MSSEPAEPVPRPSPLRWRGRTTWSSSCSPLLQERAGGEVLSYERRGRTRSASRRRLCRIPSWGIPGQVTRKIIVLAPVCVDAALDLVRALLRRAHDEPVAQQLVERLGHVVVARQRLAAGPRPRRPCTSAPGSGGPAASPPRDSPPRRSRASSAARPGTACRTAPAPRGTAPSGARSSPAWRAG